MALRWSWKGQNNDFSFPYSAFRRDCKEITRCDPCILLFFDNKDREWNTAVALLRGLMFQVIRQRPELMKRILPKFQNWNDSLFHESSFVTIWEIFGMMVEDPVATVYCVLDGLDECDECSLPILAKKAQSALFSRMRGVRWSQV